MTVQCLFWHFNITVIDPVTQTHDLIFSVVFVVFNLTNAQFACSEAKPMPFCLHAYIYLHFVFAGQLEHKWFPWLELCGLVHAGVYCSCFYMIGLRPSQWLYQSLPIWPIPMSGGDYTWTTEWGFGFLLPNDAGVQCRTDVNMNFNVLLLVFQGWPAGGECRASI